MNLHGHPATPSFLWNGLEKAMVDLSGAHECEWEGIMCLGGDDILIIDIICESYNV
jgi:hypothetical protein